MSSLASLLQYTVAASVKGYRKLVLSRFLDVSSFTKPGVLWFSFAASPVLKTIKLGLAATQE